MNFRVGDKVKIVKIITTTGNAHGKVGDIIIWNTPAFAKRIGDDYPIATDWYKFELIKGGTMSKYSDLRERIDGVTAWDKEADDILIEMDLNNKYAFYIPLDCSGTIQIHTRGRWAIQGTFRYSSQCEKLEAFKKALLWLLEHSSIKDEKQEEIEKIREDMRELQKRLDKLT